MLSDTLENHLRALGTSKETFYLNDLKKEFPKEKKAIEKLVFLGLVEPAYSLNRDVFISRISEV